MNTTLTNSNHSLEGFTSPDCSTSSERRIAAAKDLVEALLDKATDTIWIYTGGNPGAAVKSEQIITEFIYEVHRHSVHLHDIHKKDRNFKPKPVVGYCLPVPLLLYLSERGLAKAIHGALGVDIAGICKDNEYKPTAIQLYSEILNPNFYETKISQLTPQNQAAHNMISNRTEIKGTVVGGLLQIIYNSMQNALTIEQQTGIQSLITNHPIVLFVELIAFGNEAEYAKKLFNLIMTHGIQIKALAIGQIFEPHKVQKLRNEIVSTCNSVGIPVVDGLKVGHCGRQHPLLMSKCTVQFDPTTQSLAVIYDKGSDKTIGQLKCAQPQQLWNKDELRSNGLEVSTTPNSNITDTLCNIL